MPFFIRSLTKLARINGQILLEPVLISTRAVPPLLTCKRALSVLFKKHKTNALVLSLLSTSALVGRRERTNLKAPAGEATAEEATSSFMHFFVLHITCTNYCTYIADDFFIFATFLAFLPL